jgi:tRNA nucleotidyltransferase (CCA-adding enzyme)
MKNLSEYINNRFFRVITKASRELNYESYVIGGYVRDILLNRPSNDIDVVTVGSGIELAKKTAALIDGKKEVKYYGRFGTAMIRMKDKEMIGWYYKGIRESLREAFQNVPAYEEYCKLVERNFG